MNRSNRWRIQSVAFFSSFLLTAAPALAAPAPAKVSPVVQVVTTYPGMPASSIEKTITNRIERWVNQAPGVRTITSRSLAGVSIVHVYFRDDIDPNSALLTTQKLALGALPTLPPNTLPPIVLPVHPHLSRPVGVLAVHGAAASEEELKIAARFEVLEGLSRIEGATAPVALGGKDRAVLIHLNKRELQAHNLHPQDVVEALRKSKPRSRPEKFVSIGENRIFIDGTTRKLNEFKELPVFSEGKKTVRLGDIGRIEDFSMPQTMSFRINGRPAAGVPVYPSKGTNKALAEKFSQKLADLKKRMPEKTQLAWMPFGMEDKEGQADNGLLTIYMRAPSYSRLVDTEKRAAAIERLLDKNILAKEREAILSEIGMTPGSEAAYTVNAGPMDATLFVQLSRERKLSAAGYAAKLRSLMQSDPSFADLRVRFASRDMPTPVDIHIKGEKREEAMRLAQQVRRRLAAIKGAVDVDIVQRMDAPYLVIKADSRKAAEIGLSPRDVLTQIRAVLQPHAPLDRNFWIDSKSGDEHSITIPFPIDPKVKLEDALEAIAKGINVKQPIKLRSLATLQRTLGAVEIDHVDLVRVFDVRANIDERKRSDVIADIRKMIQELQVPEGIKVDLVNEK